MSAPAPTIADAEFWRRPLQARMDDFAVMRAESPFTRAEIPNLLTGEMDEFLAVTRHAELIEISRRPLDFCSGQGSTNISDMPAEALEFFGSFIAMDDPRHARQRGIVARSFTPRRLQGVLDSVETICTEVIDGFCEQGEVDLVEAFSQPFPLLVICDMMGIPRSEFDTVLRATNVILGGGDPEMMGVPPEAFTPGAIDIATLTNALFGAGIELIGLMNELAEFRRKHPTDDLTSALVNAEVGEEMLAPEEIGPFFILLAVAGNDTTRTATRDLTLSDHDISEGDKMILFYGAANRDPRVFEDPERFDVRRDPNPHVGFGGPGPHFCLGAHLARRELSVAFNQLLTRLPDIDLTGEPVHLDALGVPLVGGIKRLPVSFTPTAKVGSA